VPSWVRDVVLRGLAYESSERFASMTELLDTLGRDPSRRRQGWILAACGLTLAGLAGLGWAQHAASLRAESRIGERLIAETWNPEVRSKVMDGIGATGLPLAGEFAERTLAALDAYAAEWARTHREASEATLLHGRESEATMKQRLSCLEGARDELSALTSLLSRADAVIANHAISAAYGLPVPRACLEPGAGRSASLAADTPERRARMTALRRAVAEAEADRMTGKNEEALAIANRGLAEARAIPHRQSEAELLFLVGACQRELEDDAVARVTFEEAFAAAEAADNDSLAVIAAAVVSLELGDSLADKHEAARWLAIAKGVREREHGVADDRADAEILEAELSLESAGGHPERTFALRDQLIATLERVYGASHPRIGSAIANRAGDLASTGQQERAVAEYRRAIAMQEQIFGRNYPSLSIYYNNLGSTLSTVGRYVEAKDALDRSLALVAPLGASSSHNVLPLVSMATLENRVGDRDAALASAERGLAIADASGDVRFAPGLRVQRGIALLAKGSALAALESCQAALAEEEKQEILGPDKTYPDGEDALTCLGNAELALGRTSDAVAHLERSVSLTKRETPSELSLARFGLARALTAAKEDPARARSLAETARSELRAAKGMEEAANEVDAWLAVLR
jgi:tetratricopeptide (TPR) repeat protein